MQLIGRKSIFVLMVLEGFSMGRNAWQQVASMAAGAVNLMQEAEKANWMWGEALSSQSSPQWHTSSSKSIHVKQCHQLETKCTKPQDYERYFSLKYSTVFIFMKATL